MTAEETEKSTAKPIPSDSSGIFYGWKLVFMTLIVTAFVSAPSFGSIGVWVKALEEYFGWSRTKLAIAFSLGHLEGSAAGPVAGILVDKFGARKVVFVGLLSIGVAFVLFSNMVYISPALDGFAALFGMDGILDWPLLIFYLSFGMLMLVTVAGAWLPLMTTLNFWFEKKRSAAMGIASGGFSLGGFILLPMVAWMVDANNLGWQASSFIFAIFFFAITIPVIKIIKNKPEDMGLLPDGADASEVQRNKSIPREVSFVSPQSFSSGLKKILFNYDATFTKPDYRITQAMSTGTFWFIAIGHALCTMLLAVISVHLIPMLVENGFTLQQASLVYSLIMLVSGITQLTFGFIGDKVTKHTTIAYLGILQGIGFIMFILPKEFSLGFINVGGNIDLGFASVSSYVLVLILSSIVFGIGFGGRVPLANAIRGDYFGHNSYATISGIMMVPMSLCMLIAPLVTARLFDIGAGYSGSFIVLGILGIVGALMHFPATAPTLLSISRSK
ncbi:MAG: MFS transporter [SAR202 cluster bacterium]|nr:MFS transporter [SAR202 cluster bacterium]|tara:strand:- start:234 stop:1736 length:1503 start_codon:yes stop_codon:yes gene_type:complete